MESRELPHDARIIIESDYVVELTETSGISSQLLMDLRATDFQ